MDPAQTHVSCSPGPRRPLTSLLDLPSEIIRAVVEAVGASIHQDLVSVELQLQPTDWTDLVNLGLCCRELHALAAPIYQRRLAVSECVPFTDLVCPPSNPGPEWQWPPDRRPNAHLVRGQCERLCALHAPRLARVVSLGFSCLIATGDDETDDETVPKTLVNAACNLLNMAAQLRFLCLDRINDGLINAMLSMNLSSLRALTLNRIDAARPSLPMPYPSLAQLRALKLNFCDPAWFALIPHTTHLEDLAIRGQVENLDWFETANLLLTLRYLNLQDWSLPPDLAIELCDRIHTHRQSGKPLVLQEFGLLTEHPVATIDAVFNCLHNHTGLRSLILPVIGYDPDHIGLILESISNCGLVNLRNLELAIEPITDYGYMFTGRLSPPVLEPLRKMANLQTLVLHSVLWPDDLPATGYDSEDFKLKSTNMFLLCRSLKTVTHASCVHAKSTQFCEAHRGDKSKDGVSEIVMRTREPSQPYGVGGFEVRWAQLTSY